MLTSGSESGGSGFDPTSERERLGERLRHGRGEVFLEEHVSPSGTLLRETLLEAPSEGGPSDGGPSEESSPAGPDGRDP